jgi:FKBP-type peptidyl-prolyl cis-trans isomerase FklB
MKYIIMTVLGVVLSLGISFAGDKLELKDQNQKESYILGYKSGENFKNQGLNIDVEIFSKGLKDATGGNAPQMTTEEINATLQELQRRMVATQQKRLRVMAAKNLEEGKTFLAQNAKKDGVKTLPSGLQYKVIKEGSGKMPKAEDTVTVNYRGTFMNGTEFDSSYKRGQPATFKVNGVIKGWTEALQLMKEGAKWELFIPSDLAYGERSVGQTIPPNSTLIFEVELLSIQ